MYEAFFNLQDRPFLAAPQPDRFYRAAGIENARQILARLIERGEGAGLIVGPPGTGKTLLCQVLAAEFRDRFAVAVLSSGRLATRQALLQAILYELRLPYQGLDEGELRLALLDHLEPKDDGNEGLLLLIDEAHTLPAKLLEEVRLISNLVRDGQARVRVVVAGSPRLEERFASPRLSSFSQRLAARCYLEPLGSSETADYVGSQITAVGADASRLFDASALSTVYRATDGIPRLINQVCDHALILASLGGIERLTGEVIEEAWADLQQLPAPYTSGPTVSEGTSQIVEFGGLDDYQEDLPEAIPFRPTAPPLHLAPAEEQIEAIEVHLSHIDEEVELAGSIGTEVELDFPEFGDPFAEEFVEEEVVLERYGSAAEIFTGLPRVSSPEGRQLGMLLGMPDPTQRQKQALELPKPKLEVASVEAELQKPLRETPEKTAPAIRPVMLFDQQPMDDRDLIIVEESDSAVRAPRPLPQKLQYRQLFAKLRRG